MATFDICLLRPARWKTVFGCLKKRAGEWSHLYGTTAADNVLAQRLYSSFSTGQPYMQYLARDDV